MKDLKITPENIVLFENIRFKICRILDINTILAINIQTNEYARLKIALLSPNDADKPSSAQELSLIPDKEWEIAQYRFSIIQPVIQNRGSQEVVKEAAQLAGVNRSTIYRWIEKYEQTELVSSLLKSRENGGKGKGRLQPEVEAIIEGCIKNRLLTKQKRSIQRIVNEIIIQCKNSGLLSPHPNTIRTRISQLNERDILKNKYGNAAYRDKYEPKVNNYNEAQHPLDIVQIDHTRLDIMLVDHDLRKAIGRPWITLAIDIYSRMVLGFYISFETPGTLGTGLCISHSILPKENWLASLDIEGEWPCWGKMKTLHLDNAKEFRGKDLIKSCQEYNINIEWRPVKRPNYGGHVERLLGTALTQIHQLPGTTFSNIKDRKNYNSEKEAAFSLPEFEKWLTTYFVNVYHNSIHSTLKMRPIDKFNLGILGDGDENIGRGIPPRPVDDFKIKLDFLPIIERTIQDYGVVVDHIFYYHDVLKKWINATESIKGKLRAKKQFTFRRDPRDISKLYFFDPELKEYFTIPYRNPVHPTISLWEYRLAIKRIKERGIENFEEDDVFRAIDELREIEEQAINLTKKARYKKRLEIPNTDKIKSSIPKQINENFSSELSVEIKPFDNIDDGIETFEQ